MNEIQNILSETELFHGLSIKEIDMMRKISLDRFYDKGMTVFSEGDEANGFYVVAEGKVKIFKISAEGKEHILHIYGPGKAFGEVPVFSGGRFPAYAEPLTRSRLVFVSRTAILDLIARTPQLAMNMMAVLCMRLREFTVQIENLSLKEVPGRLAAYLILRSEENNGSGQLSLPVSKGQLASLLGTIPETLSRILKKMVSQRLIHVNGREIQILDMDGLRELSETGKFNP